MPNRFSKGNYAGSQFSSSESLASDSDFPAAIAQINTPKTALAMTSAHEYPTCSYVVAAAPARPMFLTMYTNGYVSHEIAVKYRADTTRPRTDSGCLPVASFNPPRSAK